MKLLHCIIWLRNITENILTNYFLLTVTVFFDKIISFICINEGKICV